MLEAAAPQLVLASASPRRTELLGQLGVVHRVWPADIDETPLPHEQPVAYVRRMAAGKARKIAESLPPTDAAAPVLAADTIVVAGGAILGKPGSEAEGLAMLQRLSGRSHWVWTAVCLRAGQNCAAACVSTEVSFRSVQVQEAREYWASGEPQDKAGGYGIQGLAGNYVSKIDGSYSNVIGLPLVETRLLLQALGVLSD